MRYKSNRSFPAAGGLTSRREVLRRGAAIAAVSIVAQSFPRFARAQTASTTFDFYISTTGSDSNPGTLAQPWAITSMQDTSPNWSKWAGKRLGLIAGTYNLGSMQSGSHPGTNQNNYAWSILAVPNGTQASPTYVGSSDANGNYSARAAIIVAGGPTWNGIIGPNQSPSGDFWVTVDGLVINCGGFAVDHGFQAYSGTTSIYTSAGTAKGVVVQNCEIFDIAGTGGGNNWALVFLEGTDGAIIQNNYLHDITNPPQPDHCHGFEEYGSQNTKVIYNTVFNCSGSIESKAGGSGTEVAYNYIYNSAYCCFEGFDGAEGSPNSPGAAFLIHHNVCDGNIGNAGARILFVDINSELRQPVEFYNNTIYDPSAGSVQEVRMTASGSGTVEFYNNIICCPSMTGGGNSANPGVINVTPGFYTTLDYNCYDLGALSLGLGGKTYSTLSSWQSATGADAHAIAGAAGFTSSIKSGGGSSQFMLAAGSPCVGAGLGGSNIGAWDGVVTQIGCSFVGAAPATVAPPSAPVLSVS